MFSHSMAVQRPFGIRFVTWFTTICFLMFSLTGCGVSSSQEKEIAQLISSQMVGFEQNAQASISTNKDFSQIRDGVWKWNYEKGDKGKFLAHYGYYGKNPWWKIILGVVIGLTITLVTMGMFYWSPWGVDAGIYLTVEADLQANTTTLLPEGK